MLSALMCTGDQTSTTSPPPQLSAPERESSLDSLAQSSHILRTPDLSALEVDFGQLRNSDTVPSRSDLHLGGMAPTLPRTTSQVDNRSSAPGKRDNVHNTSRDWRKKYSA
ncbi:unnamed protein product [Cutaneotrichosporon oleaginosum]